MTEHIKMTYRQAINEALKKEMRRDRKVFVYGIDTADHKRIFGTTNGLPEEFGPERCFSTPLSEDALTGFGLGAAMNGYRPVCVHMRVDFLMLCMNQLVNMVSSSSYGSGGRLSVPLVIRAVIGRGWGQAYQHNKSLQGCFAQIPGLKVVMPSTPSDAHNMLIASIRDNNPVIFIEHRWLYDAEGEIELFESSPALDQPRLIQPGNDLTIVATSWMNIEALQAAQVLKKQGVSVELIDARAVSPLDETAIIQSVQRTGNCIIADNDWLNCGFSAEVATRVYEKCYRSLKSPIGRIGFAQTPCPCTRPLENEFYGGAKDIIRMAEMMLGLEAIDCSGEDFYSYERKFKGPF